MTMPRDVVSVGPGGAAGAERRTLISVIVVVGVVLLLLAGVVMVVYNERFYQESKSQQLEAQARILASTVGAALQFDDRKAAHEYVNALAADTEIESAAVYDAQGDVFASYARPGMAAPPARLQPGEPVADADRLAVFVPVRQEGQRLGTVYVRTIVAPIFRRLSQYTVIAFLVAMGAFIFVALGVAQRRLADANARLERQSDALAHANAALRAQIEHRERAESALRQAQKMEALGQLTGGIAHDFNNLLQVIIGSLEILQRRTGDAGDEVKGTIGAARRGAERAATLTQRLLAFSRRQPLNPRSVDVNKLVAGMSELLHRTLGESITVETVLARGIPRVTVDSNQLENALLNLAVNARDAMPAGGKLTIETANAFLDAAYASAHEATAGAYVMIAVSDTGTGMDADVMQKAFEPFFTTKDIGKGSGLGLSQVYGFVTQSGGHVRIDSERGQGTTVRIYLPRVTEARDELQPAARPKGASDAPLDCVVLVVEDEQDVRAHAVSALREIGCTVLEAADAVEALRLLDGHRDVALLFTDVGLPGGMNGRELAEHARAHHPGLRVLFTTGYARDAIVHQGRLDPGVDLIPKPFTYADLAERVYRILSPQRAGDLPKGAAEGAR